MAQGKPIQNIKFREKKEKKIIASDGGETESPQTLMTGTSPKEDQCRSMDNCIN